MFTTLKTLLLSVLVVSVTTAWKSSPGIQTYLPCTNLMMIGADSTLRATTYLSATTATQTSSQIGASKSPYGIAGRIRRATNLSSPAAARTGAVASVAKGSYGIAARIQKPAHPVVSSITTSSSVQSIAISSPASAQTQPLHSVSTIAGIAKGSYGIAARVRKSKSPQSNGGITGISSKPSNSVTSTSRSTISSSVRAAPRPSPPTVGVKGSYGIAARVMKPSSTYIAPRTSGTTSVTAVSVGTVPSSIQQSNPIPTTSGTVRSVANAGVARGSYGIAARVVKPSASRTLSSNGAPTPAPSSSVPSAESYKPPPPMGTRGNTGSTASTTATATTGASSTSARAGGRAIKPTSSMNIPPAAPSKRVAVSSGLYMTSPSAYSSSTGTTSSSSSSLATPSAAGAAVPAPSSSQQSNKRKSPSKIVLALMTLAAAAGLVTNPSLPNGINTETSTTVAVAVDTQESLNPTTSSN